jgi:hypothetical protein
MTDKKNKALVAITNLLHFHYGEILDPLEIGGVIADIKNKVEYGLLSENEYSINIQITEKVLTVILKDRCAVIDNNTILTFDCRYHFTTDFIALFIEDRTLDSKGNVIEEQVFNKTCSVKDFLSK